MVLGKEMVLLRVFFVEIYLIVFPLYERLDKVVIFLEEVGLLMSQNSSCVNAAAPYVINN